MCKDTLHNFEVLCRTLQDFAGLQSTLQDFAGVPRSLWMLGNVIDEGERIVEGQRCHAMIMGDEEHQ
jgi:hypothetical protein